MTKLTKPKSFSHFSKGYSPHGLVSIGISSGPKVLPSPIVASIVNLRSSFLLDHPISRTIFYYPEELPNVRKALDAFPEARQVPLKANFLRHGGSAYFKRNYALTASVDLCIVIGYGRTDLESFCKKMERSYFIVPHANN